MSDRPGRGILSRSIDDFGRSRDPRDMEAVTGLIVTHLASNFTGAITEVNERGVVLMARGTGLERHFPMRKGDFIVRGSRVTLVRPPSWVQSSAEQALVRTASGSISTGRRPARVARTSRLFVEGVHDAELVEKVWGDDLRVDGIVVELLDGIDHLEYAIEQFVPAPDARLGILVDHLVPGSKESRTAARLARPHVLILGTPYVDIWQAIRPSVVGRTEWPSIPKGVPWKQGICDSFGEPSPGRLWKRLLGQVNTYADLEPALVRAVESLIDFITEVESSAPPTH